ncbi:HET-domain-containing protein, partial [Polyplosphaeria fusca]
YAALSYCWGGSQTFKTTTRSLSGYTEKINIDNLPQTLQDAIFVTWNLDLRYIWIDALCIIQDSDSDKAFEIGQMARVYSNATITIAATRAKAVWGGFLGERTMLGLECPNRVFSLPCQLGGEDLGNIILLPSIHEGLDPLDTRGWTFQERILSPRIIDFGTFRTQYTCQNSLGEAPCDGWSSQPIEQAYGAGLNSRVMSDLISGSYPTQDMLSYWLGIVSGFTNRVLSFPSDRLPAIAGMAECFGLILKDDYLAGHWRAGLLPSLLWSNPRLMDLLPRATGGNVDVPSWSWASASGHIIFHSFSTNPDDTTYFAAGVIECTTEPTDMRVPYGGVKQGELLLQ